MSPIIDLQRRLVEVGRIRLGARADTGRPVKLESFRFTSPDRQRIELVAAAYGGTVQAWNDQWEVITSATSVPVALIPGQNLSAWYELWSGGGCQRRCDGATETISDQPCLCDPDKRECKPHTRLNVLLPAIPGVGCWRLETTGWNAAVELAGVADLLDQITRRTGELVPARLRLEQRARKTGGETHRFVVPVLDIDLLLDDVRQALGVTVNDRELPSHTPIPADRQISDGVTVSDGIKAVNEQEPKSRSQVDIGKRKPRQQPRPLPAPDSDGEPHAASDPPAASAPTVETSTAATPAQGSSPSERIISQSQRARMFAIATEHGVNKEAMRTIVEGVRGQASTSGMTVEEMDRVLEALRS